MKEYLKYLFAAAVLALFLPFLLTALFSGRDALALGREPDPEMLIPAVVCREVEEDSPSEMLKAQAILTRSRLLLAGTEELAEILEENREYEQEYRLRPDLLERCRQAAGETKGLALTVGGAVAEGPFYPWSGGRTRNGEEAAGAGEYSWITGVDSSADQEHPDYLQEIRFSREELGKLLGDYLQEISAETISSQIRVSARDSADYATEVKVGDTLLSGEKFRLLLSLPSACFTIQEEGGEICFSCRGKGHGLGMSQYGAARMAEEGKTAEEILKYFFPGAAVERIED